MIIGDPNSFSIVFEVVEEWNSINTKFNNGVLLLTINGHIFPREIQVAPLSRELWTLHTQMMNLVVQQELFGMEKEVAFHKMYNLVHPQDIDDEYEYNYSVTPDSFSDNDYFVFVVGNGEQIRIIASDKLSYNISESRHFLEKVHVEDVILGKQEYNLIIKKLGVAVTILGQGTVPCPTKKTAIESQPHKENSK